MLIEPSDILRNKARVAGETDWLRELPSLVNTLSAEWGFTAMREDADELLAADSTIDASWQRAHWLAERCGLDPVATWEWGVVERVSTGLLGTQLGLQPFGRDMLAVSDALAEASLT